MNATNFDLAGGVIGASYAARGAQEASRREAAMTRLLSQRQMPNEGWSDAHIELLLRELASMDSNNYVGNAGVGEREGRVFSAIVKRRHFDFSHGVGRSGELRAMQPKAAGSSLVAAMCEWFAMHALRIAGYSELKACVVLPAATGVALMLALLALRPVRPRDARFVIWPRIDQKTCFKSLLSAGLEPLVVQNALQGEQLCTDLPAIEALIAERGADSIFGIVSTTSCFAPRGVDSVIELARLASRHNLVHVVNNAYGVQASATAAEISRAMRVGRIDVVVSSTDKNFLVPVGGALAYSSDAAVIERVSKAYPGRASGSPCLDLFITLLSMGERRFRELLAEREALFVYARAKLAETVAPFGERVLETPRNRISIGVTLSSVPPAQVAHFGAQLFARNVSGARAIDCVETKRIDGVEFRGWGSSCDSYKCAYFTVAVAIGSQQSDIDTLCTKLTKLMRETHARQRKEQQHTATQNRQQLPEQPPTSTAAGNEEGEARDTDHDNVAATSRGLASGDTL
jgi:O-phospho-L-seryl-tRNASec:L-selenocysteinyl-tRNA synthase